MSLSFSFSHYKACIVIQRCTTTEFKSNSNVDIRYIWGFLEFIKYLFHEQACMKYMWYFVQQLWEVTFIAPPIFLLCPIFCPPSHSPYLSNIWQRVSYNCKRVVGPTHVCVCSFDKNEELEFSFDHFYFFFSLIETLGAAWPIVWLPLFHSGLDNWTI